MWKAATGGPFTLPIVLSVLSFSQLTVGSQLDCLASQQREAISLDLVHDALLLL